MVIPSGTALLGFFYRDSQSDANYSPTPETYEDNPDVPSNDLGDPLNLFAVAPDPDHQGAD